MVDTARRAVAELAASQHRAFTRKQAAELNFDRRRVATALREGWVTEPIPGVLAVRDGPPTWEQRLQVVVLAARSRGVVSHRSAARLLRLDGYEGPGNATLEISVPNGIRFRPAVSAVVHQVSPLDRRDVVCVAGFPCTSLDVTLCDLGSVVRAVKPVRRALTSARRRGLDLVKTRATAERRHRSGQAGSGVLLRLLDTIPWEGRSPASWFEELLALCLDDPTLPEMVLQHPIRDMCGRKWPALTLRFRRFGSVSRRTVVNSISALTPRQLTRIAISPPPCAAGSSPPSAGTRPSDQRKCSPSFANSSACGPRNCAEWTDDELVLRSPGRGRAPRVRDGGSSPQHHGPRLNGRLAFSWPLIPLACDAMSTDGSIERENMTWEMFGTASRDIAQMVADDGYEPYMILSIARGGLLIGGALGYSLAVKNVYTMNVE